MSHTTHRISAPTAGSLRASRWPLALRVAILLGGILFTGGCLGRVPGDLGDGAGGRWPWLERPPHAPLDEAEARGQRPASEEPNSAADDDSVREAERAAARAAPVASEDAARAGSRRGKPEPSPADREAVLWALSDDGWYRRPQPADQRHARGHEPLWHHEPIALLAVDVGQVEWSAFWDDERNLVRANAAIAAAHELLRAEGAGSKAALAPAGLVDRLQAAVDNSRLKLDVRLAAAEALAHLPVDVRQRAAEELLARWGNPQRAGNRYVADLHATLLPGVVGPETPADHPLLVAGLASRSPRVRLATVQTLSRLAEVAPRDELPAVLIDALHDADVDVRRAAVELLGRFADPRASELLLAALDDGDYRVRLAAIRRLGRRSDPEANEALVSLLREGGELDRMAAVEGLAGTARLDLLARAAEDRSWRVRRGVAEALEALSPLVEDASQLAEAGELLGRLVVDANSLVQASAVEAAAHWPLEIAVPALLRAAEKSGFHARREAVSQLAQRWPPAADLTLDATGHVAKERLAELERTWQQQAADRLATNVTNATTAEGAPRPGESSREANVTSPSEAVDKQTLAAFERFVARLAAGEISVEQFEHEVRGLVDDPLAALDDLVRRPQTWLPPALLEWLSGQDETFSRLAALSDAPPVERRLLARRVAAEADISPLRPVARWWLAELLSDERDPLVWQSLAGLLLDDPLPSAAKLSRLALRHPAAEARVWACRYVARHPSDEALAEVAGLLGDDDSRVVLAAVEALVANDDGGPYREQVAGLLDHREPRVRIEAAAVLAAAGDERGIAALERAAHDGDARVRVTVAERIGRLGRPELAGILIAQLEDPRLGVQRAAMNALRELAGVDVGRPPEDRSPRLAEEVRRWKAWWAEAQTSFR